MYANRAGFKYKCFWVGINFKTPELVFHGPQRGSILCLAYFTCVWVCMHVCTSMSVSVCTHGDLRPT